MTPSIYIHVGAHKTGTTFLHKQLQGKRAELLLQGCRYEPSGVNIAKTLLARGASVDSLTAEKIRHEILNTHKDGEAERLLLVSEHFMGNPQSGYSESGDIARSLAKLTRDLPTKILISVRRQDQFIESWYGQSIKEGGFWAFKDYLENFTKPGPDWNRIVADYESAFGADNVRVVSYDECFVNPAAILDAHFLGWFYEQSVPCQNAQPINPSLNIHGLELLRQANLHLQKDEKNSLRRILEEVSPRSPAVGFNLFSPSSREAWLSACAGTNQLLIQRHAHLRAALEFIPAEFTSTDEIEPHTHRGFEPIAIETLKLVIASYEARLSTCKQDIKNTRAECAEKIAGLKASSEQTWATEVGKARAQAEKREAQLAAQIQRLENQLKLVNHPLRALGSYIADRIAPSPDKKSAEKPGKEIQRLKKNLQRQTERLHEANRLLSRLRPTEGLELETQFDTRPLPADGSLVFATTIDDAFAPGLECLIHSLQTQHPGLAVPFHVYHDNGLSPATIAYLRTLYTPFEFHEINPADYEGIEPHKRIGHASFRILEAFRFPGAARVIALDADMICLNPVGKLLDLPADAFAASLNVGENLIPYTLTNSQNPVFNSGVMHIPSNVRGEETFRELLEMAREGVGKDDPAIARFADQRVLNHYFRTRPLQILGLSYNANVKLGAVHLDFDLKRVGLLHFTGPKPWTLDPRKAELDDHVRPLHQLWHKLYHEARAKNRPAYFKSTGALAQIEALRNIHAGKRAFILGNGPSLRHQDLSLLKNEITFAGNWFALHDGYAKIDPRYYCLCSHTIFGGWDSPQPKLDENLHKILFERTAAAIKFFSFDFRDYLDSSGLFAGHDLRYLLYEKPLKRFVDSVGDFNLDPAQPLHDGHTVVVTFALFLAHWMGIKEVYLLGCDCDYGIKQESDEKQYFYDSALHTTKTSAFDHLQKVWSPEGGRIFKTYDIVRDVLKKHGVKVYNATHGGCLESFPRRSYDSLFNT